MLQAAVLLCGEQGDAAVIPGPGHGPARGREPREEDPLGDQQEQPRELRHRHRPRSWASRPRQESVSAVHFL